MLTLCVDTVLRAWFWRFVWDKVIAFFTVVAGEHTDHALRTLSRLRSIWSALWLLTAIAGLRVVQ